MRPRRLALLGSAVLALALVVPASAADPTVTVALSPDHGLPETSVHVTVTVDGCTATGVQVSLSGRPVSESSSFSAGSDASATMTAVGRWEADLRVHDLAAPQDSAVEAQVTCADRSPSIFRGSRAFHVDGFTTQQVVVSPDPVTVGHRLSFVMTGGHGSCESAFFRDAGGTTWTLWFYDNVYGPTITTRRDSSQAPQRVSGSFAVPADAHPGLSTVDIRCTQAVAHPARFTVLGAPSPSPHTSAPGAAPSAAVSASPSSGPSVTPSPVPSPTSRPTLVASRPTSYGRSVGLGTLLGLLVVGRYALSRRRSTRRS